MLDKDIYTREEISMNYEYLISKWGEWEIIGKTGSFTSVQFVDIRKAFFSGLMMTYITLAIICIIIAIVIGKILLPKLSQYYSNNNQDMVNMAALQTNAAIQKRNKKNDEEWF